MSTKLSTSYRGALGRPCGLAADIQPAIGPFSRPQGRRCQWKREGVTCAASRISDKIQNGHCKSYKFVAPYDQSQLKLCDCSVVIVSVPPPASPTRWVAALSCVSVTFSAIGYCVPLGTCTKNAVLPSAPLVNKMLCIGRETERLQRYGQQYVFLVKNAIQERTWSRTHEVSAQRAFW